MPDTVIKIFTDIDSFNPHNKPTKKVIFLSSFNKGENQDIKRFSDLPQDIHW